MLLSVRILAASLLTFALARLFGLPQSYWAVLTAVIVMQANVGGSLRATRDRFLGSLTGAAWGVAVCLAVPHHDVLTLGIALAIAIAPLAVLSAFLPVYRIAPVTAIIILLTPTSQLVGPVAAAFQRLLEVGLGSAVAVAVALVLAPVRAQVATAQAAGRALSEMGELIVVLMSGLSEARDPTAADAPYAAIRKAIAEAEVAAAEAERERALGLAAQADSAALCRTLRRLHHDLAMIGRATIEPLPPPVGGPLQAPALAEAETVAAFLRAAGEAVASRRSAPSPSGPDDALEAFRSEVARLRATGVTAALPAEAVARLFGLVFALEQLDRDLRDLADRAAEHAEPSAEDGVHITRAIDSPEPL
jgi:uncharacterized membrane protein YccC